MRTAADLKLVAGFLALGVGGFVFGVLPSIRSTGELDAECDELRQRVALSDDGAAALQRLAEQLAKSKAYADEITVPIPDESGVAGLIRQLSEELDAAGVEGREITTGIPTELESASSMPMSVTMEGSFLSVFSAVDWIEHLPRLIRIQRLVIKHNAARGEDPSGIVRGELLLDVFFAPEEPDAGSAKADASGGGS